jgi:hypothetical protein
LLFSFFVNQSCNSSDCQQGDHSILVVLLHFCLSFIILQLFVNTGVTASRTEF